MSLRNCLIVVWVYVVYVIGTWLFISGYLMRHFVVYQNSSSNVHVGSSVSCRDFSSLHTISEDFIQSLRGSSVEITKKSFLQRFDKAVIIIIDALRYDFVLNSTAIDKDEGFYLNKMPVFTKLVRKFPQNAVLLQLTADPPTTTLQRLKGITTGSLPTFIDISRNFAGSEIMEDNLIRQMNRMNKSIVFMGDDTWDGIFPNQFTRSFSYPSFNVKDLDTVDNGILEHIYEELKKTPDILIAHFLGVDHCGHRYGPKHPEMSRKLSQMNNIILKIAEILNNKTILLVLGDHGMTNTGDHGGDSSKETSTALFLYSRSKIVFDHNVHVFQPVSQIDIVPTLSLLLGLPIPFSNLGSIVHFLFTLNSDDYCFNEEIDVLLGGALAAAENALQIHRYLKAYSFESGEIDMSYIATAEENLKNVSYLWKNITNNVTVNSELISKIKNGYREYTQNVYNIFGKKWTTFNIGYMMLGLIVLCLAVFFNILCADQINNEYVLVIVSSIVFMFIHKFLYVFCPTHAFILLAFIICCISVKFILRFKTYFIFCLLSMFNIQSLILFLLFLCSFSNSFIIYEDHVTLYLLQSVILYRYYPFIIGFLKHNFQTGKTKSSKHNQKINYAELLLLVCLMISIRIGSIFFKCREEQINCVNTDFTLSLEKLHVPQSYKILRLFLSLASIITPVVIFLYLSSYKSTTKVRTATAMIIRYGIFFVCIFTSLRWWLNIASPEAVEKILKGNEVLLTRSALFLSIAMSLVLSIFPILSETAWTFSSKEIYSESLGTFLFIVLQILYLLAGDAISSAVTLMSASLLLHVLLIDLSASAREPKVWIDVLIWNLLSRYWFYASAHQTTFSSIQWDAAFLLTHKEIYSYILSGALVILNTFSSHILYGLAFPALLIWSQSTACSNISIRRLHMKYIFCSGIKLAGHAIACFILRRHLMVVKVFSPRLIFEIFGLITTMIAACISHYHILNVISHYHILIRKNLGHVFSDKTQ